MSDLVLAATFGEVFKTIIGVILALSGLGVLLMGVIALADRSYKSGTVAAALGAGLLVFGLWLVGAIGA